MKRVMAAALVAALLLAPICSWSSSNLPKVAESIRALQTLKTDEDSGNKFLANICTVTSIDEVKHLWLTAAHCVVNGKTHELDVSLHIANYQAYVVYYNVPADLAIIRTPELSVPALKIAKKAPTYGDDLSIWGHPFGFNEIVFVKGFLAAPFVTVDNTKYMLFSTPIAPGNSGSAVLNKNNEIVSVAQVVFAWLPAFEPIGGGVPFDTFKAFLQAAGVK